MAWQASWGEAAIMPRSVTPVSERLLPMSPVHTAGEGRVGDGDWPGFLTPSQINSYELTSFDEKISIGALASVGARAWLRLARRLGVISLIDTIGPIGAIRFVRRDVIGLVRSMVMGYVRSV
jgi:hypothetical protein